jgi:hypothetical protein
VDVKAKGTTPRVRQGGGRERRERREEVSKRDIRSIKYNASALT